MPIVYQRAQFFLYLCRELRFPVLAINGYRATLNLVFDLIGMDLAANRVINILISSFEKNSLP